MVASSLKLLEAVEIFVTFTSWQNRVIVWKSGETSHCWDTHICFLDPDIQCWLSYFSLIGFSNILVMLLSQSEGISFLHLYLGVWFSLGFFLFLHVFK